MIRVFPEHEVKTFAVRAPGAETFLWGCGTRPSVDATHAVLSAGDRVQAAAWGVGDAWLNPRFPCARGGQPGACRAPKIQSAERKQVVSEREPG